MNDENLIIDFEKIVKHWIDTSEEDYQTMLILFDSKTYAWSLFLGQISVEKLLKAKYVDKNKKHAPFIHNLYRLAELSVIELTDEFADWLDNISAFNLNARYDDYKREFFTLCTKEYAKEWIEKIKIIRSWIKRML